MLNLESVWFKSVSGNVSLINTIRTSINDGKSVVLCVPRDLPWRSSLREYIDDLEGYYCDSAVDYKEEIDGQDLKNFLLENYTVDGGDSYRNQDFFEYYEKNQKEKECIIWLKGIPEERQDEVIKFCAEYMRKIKNATPIVVEVNKLPQQKQGDRIKVIEWEKCISAHDLLTYGNLAVGNVEGLSMSQKQYIANACMEIFGYDVEIFSYVLQNEELFQKLLRGEIMEVLQELAYVYDQRGEEEGHILYSYKHEQQKKIFQKLWRTQLKTFFPAIELYRANYIEKNMNKLQAQLQKKEYVGEVEGKKIRIENAEEIEIGLLRTVSFEGGIASKEEYYEMSLYREVRNDLAHIHSVTVEKMEKLWESSIGKN